MVTDKKPEGLLAFVKDELEAERSRRHRLEGILLAIQSKKAHTDKAESFDEIMKLIDDVLPENPDPSP